MNVDPVDSLAFIAARVDDLTEYIEDIAVATYGDEDLAAFAVALRRETHQAADQHIGSGERYSDGMPVRMVLESDGVYHVRFPSHPARGGAA